MDMGCWLEFDSAEGRKVLIRTDAIESFEEVYHSKQLGDRCTIYLQSGIHFVVKKNYQEMLADLRKLGDDL